MFNSVAVIEPMLRGEIELSDIIGLAALMVRAPVVYNLLREEPRWFVGLLPGDNGLVQTPIEVIKEGAPAREEACRACANKRAVRALVHHMFPLTARADDEFMLERVVDVEGHIASPRRLLVALQLHVGGTDVSFVKARHYLIHPAQRNRIAGSLTEENCLEFLEILGDVAESTAAAGVCDVEQLCVAIARLIDSEPFPSRSKHRRSSFQLNAAAEGMAERAIQAILKASNTPPCAIAERIIADPEALVLAMTLFIANYQASKSTTNHMICGIESKPALREALSKNVLRAAKTDRLLATCHPRFVLLALNDVAPEICPKVFDAIKTTDPYLDNFVLAILSHAYDFVKGQSYSLPKDRSRIESYCSLQILREHASKRLEDPLMTLPAKAAWRAVIEEKSIYGADGTYADF